MFRRAIEEQGRSAKAKLRVDAFLGEWLSPDYYENITHPPTSTLMVASAKAELLRQGEGIDVFTPTHPGVSPQGNLWGGSNGSQAARPTLKLVRSTSSSAQEAPLENWRVLAQALPHRRDRASSRSSDNAESPLRPTLPSSQLSFTTPQEAPISYTPPTPSYAVSASDPIPRGYVAHARDACVDVDFGWDSMREPQLWGDGGDYGEEWSAMHKRFRKGFLSMINWYGEHEGSDQHEAVPEPPAHDGDEEEEDLVLVLVTHSAGCNALLGALTSAPVLIDVAMASLTMATRKEDALSTTNGGPLQGHDANGVNPSAPLQDSRRRRSSIDLGLSSRYEMKIVASIEHLRPGVDAAKLPLSNVSSPFLSAQALPETRRRYGSGSQSGSASPAAGPLDPMWSIGEPATRLLGHTSSALGSIRRSSTTNIMPPPARKITIPAFDAIAERGAPASTVSSPGLWSPAARAGLFETPKFDQERRRAEAAAETARDLLPPAPPRSALATSSDATAPVELPEIAPTDGTPSHVEGAATGSEDANGDRLGELPGPGSQALRGVGRAPSQKGLWGGAPVESPDRQRMPKRRWSAQLQ
ncbi:hypothetical protein LTR28_007050 [Elasticomyces elasticus]|nr:hypothetical protein LTR28_007050 [Elasticomyces elasticus]